VLYIYSLYGPYGLYRASVPVQGCTLPLLLPLPLPLPLFLHLLIRPLMQSKTVSPKGKWV